LYQPPAFLPFSMAKSRPAVQVGSCSVGTLAAFVLSRISKPTVFEPISRVVPGRDVRFRAPPGQFRASPIRALGSYLGCLTAKRTLAQGCRTRGGGGTSSASFVMRVHST